MPSRNTYRLTWVSLTLDVGYFFTAGPANQNYNSHTSQNGHHQYLQTINAGKDVEKREPSDAVGGNINR